jgi:hypothetical protein
MLNGFHHTDHLFRTYDISVLTGKVVGDTPISPSVMAGTPFNDAIRVFNVAQAFGCMRIPWRRGGIATWCLLRYGIPVPLTTRPTTGATPAP